MKDAVVGDSAPGDAKKYYGASDVAKVCEVDSKTVRLWVKSGKLKATETPGGHTKVRAEDFRSFLEKYEYEVPDYLK